MHNYTRQKLILYRRRHGLKQDAFAERLGVSQATLSRWEAGVTEPTPGARKRVQALLFKDQNFELAKLIRLVRASPRRALSAGEDITLHAVGLLAPKNAPIGQSQLRWVPDPAARLLRETWGDIERGEVVGSMSHRVGPVVAQRGDLAAARYMTIVNSYSVVDGLVIHDTQFHALASADWERLGGKPSFRLITLDD